MSDLPQTSRAACVVAFQKPLEIREVSIPDSLEPGAILVQIEVATICGSDVHLRSTRRWKRCAPSAR